jgi:hypothetical protein
MKYLRFSILLLLVACGSGKNTLPSVQADENCIGKMMPRGIETSWFDASVDVKGRHLGGLLLIKQMPDSINRIVFTSETGVTIFDFEYQRNGKFSVKRIIEQLDRKIIVEVLQKDFALMLGLPFRNQQIQAWKSGSEIYYGAKAENEYAYFITDSGCQSLIRLESASGSTPKFSILFEGKTLNSPDNIAITHHTFDMVINLKKLEKDVSQ